MNGSMKTNLRTSQQCTIADKAMCYTDVCAAVLDKIFRQIDAAAHYGADVAHRHHRSGRTHAKQ